MKRCNSKEPSCQRFRSKTWKAARTLLLISFLGAGGYYYQQNEKDGDTDRESETTSLEKLIAKEGNPKATGYQTETEYRDMLKHNVGAVLRDADLFKKEPWAENLIRESVDTALERAPDYVLRHAGRFKDYPWGMEKIRAAVESNKTYYGDVLEYAESYKNEPWAEAKIKRGVEESITKRPREAVIYAQNYIISHGVQNFLKKLFNQTKIQSYINARRSQDWRSQPWGGEMLKTLVGET